jgi:hypothetical protein
MRFRCPFNGRCDRVGDGVDSSREAPTGFRLSHHREGADCYAPRNSLDAWNAGRWSLRIVGGPHAGARGRFTGMIYLRGRQTACSLLLDRHSYRVHQYLNGCSPNGIDRVYCRDCHFNRYWIVYTLFGCTCAKSGHGPVFSPRAPL